MRTIGRDFGDTARKVYATASGALGNGKACVVNSDGTVSVVSGATTSSAGTPVVIDSDDSTGSPVAVSYDSNNDKFVFSFADSSSGPGISKVGTISGSTISFGSAVTFEANEATMIVSTFDSSNNKIVIAFADGNNSNLGTAIVGTVSGTSISFGSQTVFESGATFDNASITFDSNSNKVVIAYRNNSDGAGVAIVGTVSGTSISFGSKTTFETGSTYSTSCAFDSNSNKIVIAYKDSGNSGYGTAIVGTVSGTSISFGTAVVYQSSNIDERQTTTVFDSTNNKIIIAYRRVVGPSVTGTAIVGTVSGTSISFGTAVVFSTSTISNPSATFVNGKVFIGYDPTGGTGGVFIEGTVSGTSISFGTAIAYENANCSFRRSASNGTDKVVFAYNDGGNSGQATAVVVTPENTNLTSENFIGISSGDVTYFNEGLGSAVEFDTSSGLYPRGASNGNGTILVVFRYTNNHLYGIVGVISGSSVTFGTSVAIHAASTGAPIGIVYDPDNDKFIVSYQDSDDSDKGKAVVITVSGTSISQGSHVTFETGTANDQVLVYDTNSNKVVIIYRDVNDDAFGIVGTVSGTSISFGSASSFDTGNLRTFSAAFDSSNNKVVVAYQDYENSRYGTSAVGTVSGTSISFGTPVVFESATTPINGVIFDSNSNKIGIFYRDAGNSSYLTGIVGTVSGTSISFGSPTATSQAINDGCSASFSSGLNTIKVVVETSSDAIVYYVATISGTSVSFGSQVVLENTQEGSDPFTFYNTSNNAATVFLYADEGFDGNIRIYAEASSSGGEVANGGTALIDTKGAINDNQNALTPGQSYFVQTDGTLGLTAADPSVLAGTAVAANKIIVKG